jgi:hypothetical protein
VRHLVASLAVVALLAGCGGGGSNSTFSPAACRAQADKVVAHADSMLLHYGGGTVYPADMSYLGLKSSLDRFDRGGCPATMLGTRLRHTFTPSQRKTLLALLPRASATRIHDAIDAA